MLLALLVDYSDVFAQSKDELVVLMCCSMGLLLIVWLLFVNGLRDYPQRDGWRCVPC